MSDLWLGLGTILEQAEAAETPACSSVCRTPGWRVDKQAPDPIIFRSCFVTINWGTMNYPDATAQNQTTGANRIVLNPFEDVL
jgi:hypothetical protein